MNYILTVMLFAALVICFIVGRQSASPCNCPDTRREARNIADHQRVTLDRMKPVFDTMEHEYQFQNQQK